jgi:hypothetical protein
MEASRYYAPGDIEIDGEVPMEPDMYGRSLWSIQSILLCWLIYEFAMRR